MDYSTKTILIVEDEEILQSAFAKSFEKQGFKVLTADDGKDGLDIIRSARPDIVIMDLMMPRMNGEEVLEVLDKDGLTKEVPIIILSNKSDGASLYKCKKLGARAYLIKVNATIEVLIDKINEIFAESK